MNFTVMNFTQIKSHLNRFKSEQKGTVAVIFAISAIPFLMAAGAAIDYAHFSAVKTQLQTAIDAGALAAASSGYNNDTARIAIADKIFAANMADGSGSNAAHSALFVIEDNVVKGSGSADVPLSFMQLAGLDLMHAEGSAEVGIAQDKKAEIALVLDYSGSMEEYSGGQIKYEAMRDAAKSLVEDLAAADPTKVKFALVPFSHHVYTTLPSSYVLGATGSTWTGCTQDRKYPHNRSSATPIGTNGSKWGQPQAPEHLSAGCPGYVDHNLTTVTLTDNFSDITGRLDIMTPYAWTHIALGVEFGYHILSPNAPFTEGVAFSDNNTEKFMVVLTDGQQTEPGFGPGGSRNVSQGEKNLEALCTSAKADGITMITMAFDLDDTVTRTRLKNCATDPVKNFFIADDSADLVAAFETIKQAITAEVYLSK